MNNESLTNSERTRLTHLEQRIKTYRDQERVSVFEAGKALLEIRESKLYREDGTFEEYCRSRWGWSRQHAYRVCDATEFREGQLLLAECSDLDVVVPKTEREARKLKTANVTRCDSPKAATEKNKSNLSKSVSAKLEPDGVIEYSKPPPMPISFRQEVAELVKLLDGLLMGEGGFALSQKFRHAVFIAKKIQQEVQGELPGMAEHFPKFKAPTLEQVQSYAATINVSASDAQSFFDGKQGIGWKDVKDWQAVLRNWKSRGFLASQKFVDANGRSIPKPKSIIQQDMERLAKQVERL